MSASQRRKGAEHERSVVKILKEHGHECARNLDQWRDGGGDIYLPGWAIECKRRASIAIYDWWQQCCAVVMPAHFHRGGEVPKPLLVIRADGKENLAVLRLTDFLKLIEGDKHGQSSAATNGDA